MDNWADGKKTLQEALDNIVCIAGAGKVLVWQKDDGLYYANDGIDPATGNDWKSIPRGARYYNAK